MSTQARRTRGKDRQPRRPRRPRKALVSQALLALREASVASAAEIGLSASQAGQLAVEGLIKPVGTRKHVNENGEPTRGRPALIFRLDKKGRDRARRLAQKVQAQEPVAA